MNEEETGLYTVYKHLKGDATLCTLYLTWLFVNVNVYSPFSKVLGIVTAENIKQKEKINCSADMTHDTLLLL